MLVGDYKVSESEGFGCAEHTSTSTHLMMHTLCRQKRPASTIHACQPFIIIEALFLVHNTLELVVSDCSLFIFFVRHSVRHYRSLFPPFSRYLIHTTHCSWWRYLLSWLLTYGKCLLVVSRIQLWLSHAVEGWPHFGRTLIRVYLVMCNCSLAMGLRIGWLFFWNVYVNFRTSA